MTTIPTKPTKIIIDTILWTSAKALFDIGKVVLLSMFFTFPTLIWAEQESKSYEAVDLGLPSGTLWATCNVGATHPEEYGDYFAWGETTPQPQKDYSWNSYKWCVAEVDKLTKYCNGRDFGNDGFRDMKTELDFEDDAAYVNWGGDWRTPSLAQIKELEKKCKWEWAVYKGVKGYIVKGRNGNSIFLPSASWCLYSLGPREGNEGGYWSRSICKSNPNCAFRMVFFSGGLVEWNGYFRCSGLSVRPVRIKKD